jgi:hypothetical protein
MEGKQEILFSARIVPPTALPTKVVFAVSALMSWCLDGTEASVVRKRACSGVRKRGASAEVSTDSHTASRRGDATYRTGHGVSDSSAFSGDAGNGDNHPFYYHNMYELPQGVMMFSFENLNI